MIKTYKGQLADGGQDRIRLQTIKGKVGYRIVRFEIFLKDYTGSDRIHGMTVWRNEQSSVPTNYFQPNFTDSDILAVAIIVWDQPGPQLSPQMGIVFADEIFNQDIFVTHTDEPSAYPANYYLELESFPLDDAGAEYTTLKDMRQS